MAGDTIEPTTHAPPVRLALLGQPNCGKSTLFNALTGLHQHVANYPGITLEKKSGRLAIDGRRFEVVDLPGTYSLTAFSPEERVVRGFLLDTAPALTINVVDATNLRRSLHLTIQALEMGLPLVLVLNMADVARRNGQTVAIDELSRRLGVPAVETVGRRGEGLDRLVDTVGRSMRQADAFRDRLLPQYGPLEPEVRALEAGLPPSPASRWLALRVLEGDPEAESLLRRDLPDGSDALLAEAARHRDAFMQKHGMAVADHVVAVRERAAAELEAASVSWARAERPSLTERVDHVILNRWLAPVVLLGTIYAIYHTAIVQGYELTHYTWPILAGLRNLAADWLPAAGFIDDPLTRSFGLWLIDSINTLLNYVPIFLILFALIAILEDSGYMARIAFILDRVLHRFGLHGQSTLPLILGGVFAGGCAVPGVMATKGIPDPRARLATILTVPYMNCLAKIPLYTLLISMFFVDHKGLMMFFIATITIMVALLVARLLTFTVLRGMETVPFVMEMPRYHLPTLRGVAGRSLERTWLYVKKVGTVVAAVAVVIFVLLHIPGLSSDQRSDFEERAQVALDTFRDSISGTPYAAKFADPAFMVETLNLATAYRARRMTITGAEGIETLDARMQARYPESFMFVRPGGGDRTVRDVNRALRTLDQERRTLRREMQEARIVDSLLGRLGRALEPLTQAAGFDWKINVALLSSFAARESSVATLGVLFQQDEGGTQPLEERMAAEMTHEAAALTALALIVFFAIYPPCLATTIMVRLQTGSTGWMLFSIVFPTALGLAMASAVYSGGLTLNLNPVDMMVGFWLTVLVLLVLVGAWPRRPMAPKPARGTGDL